MNLCIHAHINTCMHTCKHAPTCKKLCMYSCMHVFMYACMDLCKYALYRPVSSRNIPSVQTDVIHTQTHLYRHVSSHVHLLYTGLFHNMFTHSIQTYFIIPRSPRTCWVGQHTCRYIPRYVFIHVGSLSIYPSIHPAIYLSIALSIKASIILSVSVCMCVCIYVCVCMCALMCVWEVHM